MNAPLARIGLRTTLPAFGAARVGQKLVLYTGQVGDEGWFAPKWIPATWASAGPTADGLRNYFLAGPGLGSGRSPELLLDKVRDVTPLRATGLMQLLGRQVCAVVYKSDVAINYGPLSGSLKGANLGVVAFEVLSATRRSNSALPKVEVRILGREATCGAPLELHATAPAPTSSSQPFDVVP